MIKVSKQEIFELLSTVMANVDWENETRLVSDRVLDSLSIVNIVSELSMEYDIEFDLDELSPENMDTLDAITDTVNMLISRKK